MKLEKEDWASFEDYPTPREGVPLDCDQSILQVVAGKISGGAGPNSVDGMALKRYLLNYKEYSLALRQEMALWVKFLGNNFVPFAAHRVLQTCRLGALDKQPWVRPLGVGSSTKRLIAKCTLKVIGDGAKAACGNVNLCAGLEAGIEGALHAVKARAADGAKMDFGDWEVDHSIFLLTAEEGETQDSLPRQLPGPPLLSFLAGSPGFVPPQP